MTRDDVLRQFDQLEAQLQLTAASLRALRDLVVPPEPVDMAEPEEDAEGNCLHPADCREPAPAMGRNRNRFICHRCGSYGPQQENQ